MHTTTPHQYDTLFILFAALCVTTASQGATTHNDAYGQGDSHVASELGHFPLSHSQLDPTLHLHTAAVPPLHHITAAASHHVNASRQLVALDGHCQSLFSSSAYMVPGMAISCSAPSSAPYAQGCEAVCPTGRFAPTAIPFSCSERTCSGQCEDVFTWAVDATTGLIGCAWQYSTVPGHCAPCQWSSTIQGDLCCSVFSGILNTVQAGTCSCPSRIQPAGLFKGYYSMATRNCPTVCRPILSVPGPITSCSLCVVPLAFNKVVSQVLQGSLGDPYQAIFQCLPGSYAPAVMSQCASVGLGAWEPNPDLTVCRPCLLPKRGAGVETIALTVNAALLSPATVSYSCASGYFGCPVRSTCNTADGSWSALPPNCQGAKLSMINILPTRQNASSLLDLAALCGPVRSGSTQLELVAGSRVNLRGIFQLSLCITSVRVRVNGVESTVFSFTPGSPDVITFGLPYRLGVIYELIITRNGIAMDALAGFTQQNLQYCIIPAVIEAISKTLPFVAQLSLRAPELPMSSKALAGHILPAALQIFFCLQKPVPHALPLLPVSSVAGGELYNPLNGAPCWPCTNPTAQVGDAFGCTAPIARAELQNTYIEILVFCGNHTFFSLRNTVRYADAGIDYAVPTSDFRTAGGDIVHLFLAANMISTVNAFVGQVRGSLTVFSGGSSMRSIDMRSCWLGLNSTVVCEMPPGNGCGFGFRLDFAGVIYVQNKVSSANFYMDSTATLSHALAINQLCGGIAGQTSSSLLYTSAATVPAHSRTPLPAYISYAPPRLFAVHPRVLYGFGPAFHPAELSLSHVERAVTLQLQGEQLGQVHTVIIAENVSCAIVNRTQVSNSTDILSCMVMLRGLPAGSSTLSVTLLAGPSEAPWILRWSAAVQFTTYQAITSILPSSAPPGSNILILGDGFGHHTADVIAVFVGDQPCQSKLLIDAQSLVCTLPTSPNAYEGQVVRVHTIRGEAPCSSKAQHGCTFSYPRPIAVVVSTPSDMAAPNMSSYVPVLASSETRYVLVNFPIMLVISGGYPSRCSFTVESEAVRGLSVVGTNGIKFNVSATTRDETLSTSTMIPFPSIARGTPGVHGSLSVQCISQFGDAAVGSTQVHFKLTDLRVVWQDELQGAFQDNVIPPFALPSLKAECTTEAAVMCDSFVSNLACSLRLESSSGIIELHDMVANYTHPDHGAAAALRSPHISLSSIGMFDKLRYQVICTWLPSGVEYSTVMREVRISIPRIIPTGTLRDAVGKVVNARTVSHVGGGSGAIEAALGIPGYYFSYDRAPPPVDVPVVRFYAQRIQFALEFYDIKFGTPLDDQHIDENAVARSIVCSAEVRAEGSQTALRQFGAEIQMLNTTGSSVWILYQITEAIDFSSDVWMEGVFYGLTMTCGSTTGKLAYVMLRSVRFFLLQGKLVPGLGETLGILNVSAMPLKELPIITARIEFRHVSLLVAPEFLHKLTREVGRCTNVIMQGGKLGHVVSSSSSVIMLSNVTTFSTAVIVDVSLPSVSLGAANFNEQYVMELTCYSSAPILLKELTPFTTINPTIEVFVETGQLPLGTNVTLRGRRGFALGLQLRPVAHDMMGLCHVLPQAPLYAAADLLMLGATRPLHHGKVDFLVQVDLRSDGARSGDLLVKCEAWGRKFFQRIIPLVVTPGEVRLGNTIPHVMAASVGAAPLRVALPSEPWSARVHFNGVPAREVIKCTADIISCAYHDGSTCRAIISGESTVMSGSDGVAQLAAAGIQIIGSEPSSQSHGRVEMGVSCATSYLDAVIPMSLSVPFVIPSLKWSGSPPASHNPISVPWPVFGVALGAFGGKTSENVTTFCNRLTDAAHTYYWRTYRECQRVYSTLSRVAAASTCVVSAEPSLPNFDRTSIISSSTGHYADGSIDFTNLTISGVPNSTYLVKVMCNYYDYNLPPLTVHAQLSFCPPGFQSETEDMASVCSMCKDGYFSDGGGVPCSLCPKNTVCKDGKLKLVPGFFASQPLRYFQQNLSQIMLYTCWNSEACEVQTERRAYVCAQGYTGPVCGLCDAQQGFELFDGLCRPCGSDALNRAAIVLASVFVLATLAIMLLQHVGMSDACLTSVCARSGSKRNCRLDIASFLFIIVQAVQDTGIFRWFRIATAVPQFYSVTRYASWLTEFPFAQGNFRCTFEHPTSRSLLFGTIIFPIPLGIAAFAIYYAMWYSSTQHRSARLMTRQAANSDRTSRGSVVYTSSPLVAQQMPAHERLVAAQTPRTTLKARGEQKATGGSVSIQFHISPPLSENGLQAVTSVTAFVLTAELPSMVYHAIQLLRCRRDAIDGIVYLVHDLSVVCGSSIHVQGILMSCVTFLVALALVLGPTVFAEKVRYTCRASWRTALDRGAALFRPMNTSPILHSQTQYWLSVMRLRQILLVGAATVVDDIFFQVIAALIIQSFYCWLLERVRPSHVIAYTRLSSLTAMTFWVGTLLFLLSARARLFAVTTSEVRPDVYFAWNPADMMGAAVVLLNVCTLVPVVLLGLKATISHSDPA